MTSVHGGSRTWTVIGIVRETEDGRSLSFLAGRPEVSNMEIIGLADIKMPPLPKDPLPRRVRRKLRGNRQALPGRTRLDIGFGQAMEIIDASERTLIVAVGGWAEQLAWRITRARPDVLAVQGPEIASRTLDLGGDPRADEQSSLVLNPDLIAAVLPPLSPPQSPRLVIGPGNFAGQAGRWALALRGAGTSALGISIGPSSEVLGWPADLVATDADLTLAPVRQQFDGLLMSCTHVLLDDPLQLPWRPPEDLDALPHKDGLGKAQGDDILAAPTGPADPPTAGTTASGAGQRFIRELLQSGHRVGHVSWRQPSAPITAIATELGITLYSCSRREAELAGLTWLPPVAPKSAFLLPPAHSDSGPAVVGRIGRSRDELDSALEALAEEGLIVYRRWQQIPPALWVAAMGRAQIFVAELEPETWGPLTITALAAGRAVVAHSALLEHQTLQPASISSPAEAAKVIRILAGSPRLVDELAQSARGYAREHHDGSAAAAVLSDFAAT